MSVYYLYSPEHEMTIPAIHKTNGEIIPERKVTVEALGIYKHPKFSRFYRGTFAGINGRYQGMKLYTCKTLKRILELRKSTFDYCGVWFEVHDENGKVDLPEIKAQEQEMSENDGE